MFGIFTQLWLRSQPVSPAIIARGFPHGDGPFNRPDWTNVDFEDFSRRMTALRAATESGSSRFRNFVDTATPPPGFASYSEFVHGAMMNAPSEILAEMAEDSEDDPDHS